jgi:peptidoglycan/xylan/chitin deacetylase (PgdA/CDA1 family)
VGVILIDIARERLLPSERFGLEILMDLSRLLVAEGADCELVRLTVLERDTPGGPLAALAPETALERANGEVRVTTAALRAVTEVAGAGAEQRSTAADRHGRVPAADNPLVAADRSRQPVVSLLATELRRAVAAVAGRRPVRLLAPWPGGHRWAAVLTHDLDVVEWWALFPLLRMAELGKKGAWRLTARVARAAQRSIGRDPVSRGVRLLLQLEAHHGISATWFVICAEPSLKSIVAGDSTYRPNAPATNRILRAISHAGHEIGLHGSFQSGEDPARLLAERRLLDHLTERTILGVRQHFLRMRPGTTQRAMVEAGFDYDATWGFADRNGFRLGTADVVPAWDSAQSKPLPLDLLPLIWMDRALSKYAGVEEADRWIDDGLELARESRAVEGVWVGLWHPNTTEALGFPGAETAFVRLLQALADDRPYFANARKIVEWRRFRRSVRASRISADGRLLLTAPAGQANVIAIENEGGDTTQAQVRSEPSSGAA